MPEIIFLLCDFHLISHRVCRNLGCAHTVSKCTEVKQYYYFDLSAITVCVSSYDFRSEQKGKIYLKSEEQKDNKYNPLSTHKQWGDRDRSNNIPFNLIKLGS